MPKARAMIDFGKCHPDKCEKGICIAVAACEYKLLKQEAPFGIPLPNPSLCRGCGKCALACPYKAIVMM